MSKNAIPATRTRLKTLVFRRMDRDVTAAPAEIIRKNTRAASVFDSELIQTYFPQYKDKRERVATAAIARVRFDIPAELSQGFVKAMGQVKGDDKKPVWQLGKL